MPAEWEIHERCWMMWPTGLDLDRYPDTTRMRNGYAAAANAISQFENVTMITNASTQMNAEILSAILFKSTSSPLMTVGVVIQALRLLPMERILGGVDWIFNNYGELLGPDYLNDSNVAKNVIKETSARIF